MAYVQHPHAAGSRAAPPKPEIARPVTDVVDEGGTLGFVSAVWIWHPDLLVGRVPNAEKLIENPNNIKQDLKDLHLFSRSAGDDGSKDGWDFRHRIVPFTLPHIVKNKSASCLYLEGVFAGQEDNFVCSGVVCDGRELYIALSNFFGPVEVRLFRQDNWITLESDTSYIKFKLLRETPNLHERLERICGTAPCVNKNQKQVTQVSDELTAQDKNLLISELQKGHVDAILGENGVIPFRDIMVLRNSFMEPSAKMDQWLKALNIPYNDPRDPAVQSPASVLSYELVEEK